MDNLIKYPQKRKFNGNKKVKNKVYKLFTDW